MIDKAGLTVDLEVDGGSIMIRCPGDRRGRRCAGSGTATSVGLSAYASNIRALRGG